MSGRNPMGARRAEPSVPPPPRVLPDGSESQYHEGSFHSYMAHKNRKLQEQFQERVAGQQRSQLFRGVSIHVNGFTQPSHLELKQLMALHGGNFENYYSRSTVTHIICSNLPDAKVKQYERERSPTPVLRPEWVVDSIKAGALLPIQGYALWQLRDAPGQQKLRGFHQVRSAALPPDAIFGRHAGAVGAAVEQVAAEQAGTGAGAGAASFAPAAGIPQAPASTATATSFLGAAQAVPPVRKAQGQHPAQGQMQHQQQQQQGQGQQAQLQQQGQGQQAQLQPQQHAQGQAAHPSVRQQQQLLLPLPPRPNSASRPNPPGPSPAFPTAADSPPPARPHSAGGAVPGPMASPPAGAGTGAGQVQAADGERDSERHYEASGYDAAELQQAQQIASRMRAECDLLKGPPRSSRDDPHFMESYYKSSRLHFIGTWRARIDALMASAEGSKGPSPSPHAPGRQRSIIHLDMDCFFAAVAEAGNPAFKGKPLAVCHSASSKGTGEVSTANYEARKFGVASGMMISRAKELCPHLIVVPYLFEQYESVSDQVYRILLGHTCCVQPLSCDEAYVDVTGLGDPEQIAAAIRAQIEQATGCTASAGIGPNLLLARIATERAKPNGQFCVRQEQARQFLSSLNIDKLPGVGWATEQRLAEKGIQTVADLQARSKEFLQGELGAKQGAMLWDFAHGRDNRQVEPPRARKSVGAEVNWGIRFTSDEDAHCFLRNLAGEVQQRMQQAGVKGRTLTLKIKRRKEGAAEPRKFLGHGICDSLSRSVTLARFTANPDEIGAECSKLLRALRVPFDTIRGIGITVTRLDNDAASSSARPGAAPPAKLAAPPPGRFDPDAPHPWQAFWKKQQQGAQPPQQQAEQVQEQMQQQQQQQQQQRKQQQQDHAQQQQESETDLLEAQGHRQPALPLAQEAQLEGQAGSRERLGGAETSQQQAGAPLPHHLPHSPAPEPSSLQAPAPGHFHEQQEAVPQSQGEVAEAERTRVSPGLRAAGGSSKRSPGGGSRKGPSHARQVPLEGLFQRQAAAAAAGGAGVGASGVGPGASASGPAVLHASGDGEEAGEEGVSIRKQRQQLLEQWQGTSLTQMDASVLESLPWSVQRELIDRLSRQPSGQALQQQQDQQHQQQEEEEEEQVQAGQLLAEQFEAVASTPPQAGAAAAAAAAATRVTAGSSPQRHQQEQQQHIPSSDAPSGSARPASAAADAAGAASSPIVALPALSQVDPSVLDALPLQLRRELELAYGIRRPAAPVHHGPGHGRGGGRGGGRHGGGGGGGTTRHVSKHQRLDSFLSNPPPFGVTASGRAVAAAASSRQQQQEQQQQLSLSQVDPEVLHELPAELQQEVLQQLQLQQQQKQQRGAGRVRGWQQHRSRLGLQQGQDAQQEWQRRLEQDRHQQQQQEEQQKRRQQELGALDAAQAGHTVDGEVEEIEWALAEDEHKQQQQERQQQEPRLLPAPVQRFLSAVEHSSYSDTQQHTVEAGPSSSLAAALAECLQQLQEQLQPQPTSPTHGSGSQSTNSSPASSSSSEESEKADSADRAGSNGNSERDGSSSMETDLPPTQEVPSEHLVAEAGAGAAAQAAVEAAAGPGGGGGSADLSPRQDSLQQIADPPAGPSQAPSTASPQGGASREMEQGLQALQDRIQQAGAQLLAQRDLEELRLLLRAVLRLGQRYPWFADGAGRAAAEALQQQVQRQYGWQLRLGGLLQV